ncbi:MAG: phage minor head protein [bacterium]
MAEPRIVAITREFREALLDRESTQFAEMTRRWGQVERAVQREMDAILEEIAYRQRIGDTVTRENITTLARYTEMLAQVRREVQSFQGYAEGSIQRSQEAALEAGTIDATAAVREALGAEDMRVRFDRVDPGSLQNIVGVCQDGSPLFDVLRGRALFPAAVGGLTDALVEGVAMGWNPRKTAREMMDGMAGGLDMALRVARTEQLRAYRESSMAQYRESGVVGYVKRMCAHQARTCLGCLALDGQVLPLDEPFFDHPNGRCTTIPWVKGLKEPSWKSGEEWFSEQPEAVQRDMMGAEKYEAWKKGEFTFQDLAKISDDPTWGKSVGVRSLKDLRGGMQGQGAKVVAFTAQDDDLLPSWARPATAQELQRVKDIYDRIPSELRSFATTSKVKVGIITDDSHLAVTGNEMLFRPEDLTVGQGFAIRHELTHAAITPQIISNNGGADNLARDLVAREVRVPAHAARMYARNNGSNLALIDETVTILADDYASGDTIASLAQRYLQPRGVAYYVVDSADSYRGGYSKRPWSTQEAEEAARFLIGLLRRGRTSDRR